MYDPEANMKIKYGKIKREGLSRTKYFLINQNKETQCVLFVGGNFVDATPKTSKFNLTRPHEDEHQYQINVSGREN